MITIARSLGSIDIDCTLEEVGTDRLMVTDQPVERSADITDHAYKMPAEVVIRAGWSNSNPQAGGDPDYVRNIYQTLLDLQNSRQPFDIVTGKRQYQNMLLSVIAVQTDQTTEEVLMVSATCREIILVDTQTTTLPPTANQADPSKTSATKNTGTKSLATVT